MSRIRLLIVGAGGHGRSVAEAALLAGVYEIAGFLDDAIPEGERALGVRVLGPVSSLVRQRHLCDQVMVAIGNNRVRQDVTAHLLQNGFRMATVIHPRSFVSPSAMVGAGSAIMAGAIIGTQAKLGAGVIVNCSAVVDHDAVVQDFAHLGVNASMAGGTVLGEGAWMQAGSSLGYGVMIPVATILQPGEAVSKAARDASRSFCSGPPGL
jgi:sugar O-acyltransferase (sialic acid O-acetyltransferase NeuD family)